MSGVTFNFEGKLVAVTGSTGGIGRSIAESFARAGARVIVNGRSDSTKTVAAEIGEATGAEVIPVVADVGNADGAKTFIDAVDAIGPLEILVNNVGVFAVKDFFSITDDEWQNYFDVNVMSAVRLSRHFLKAMLERGHGRVLMIASEAGMRALPHMIPYSTSKTMMIGIAHGLAKLTAGTKVTVNSVLAGPTWTPGVEKYIEDFGVSKGLTKEESIASYFKESEPTSILRRFIDPQEIADVTLFLASEAAAAVNGVGQRVEGGIIDHI